MAIEPTCQEARRTLLDVVAAQNTRAGEIVRLADL